MRTFKQRVTIMGCMNFNNPNVKNKADKKIIAVDFDGTLVHNQYPYITNPDIELIEFIKTHIDDYTWILWTCREGEQLKCAVDYLRENFGLIFDFVNCNASWQTEKYQNDSRKVYADYYIDDKNFLPTEFNLLDNNGKINQQNAH